VAVTFFEHQARARRSTSLLVVLFALAVVGVVLAVNLVVPLALYVGARGFITPSAGLYVGLTVVTLAVIGIRTLVGVLQMRGGGDAVAQLAGGVRVERGTRDADERRLLNVVDEMAIASGVSVPHVYVLRGERGINAFAAGYSPNEAVVAVTEGTARTLTRDELQGVVAHEFSHVLNGDMRLSVQMIGVLAGVLFIGEVGNFLLRARSSGDDRRSGGGIVVNVAAVDRAQGDVRATSALGLGLANAVRGRDRAGALVKHAPLIEVGLGSLKIPLERHAAVVRNQVVAQAAERHDRDGGRGLARCKDGGS